MLAIYSKEQWASWFEELAVNDFVVIDNFLPQQILSEVENYFNSVEQEHLLNPAKIGAANHETRQAEIRTDFIYWIQQEDSSLKGFKAMIDELIAEINEYLFLSIKDSEFHVAKYEKGGFYQPHFDRFAKNSNRLITFLVYLNENWQEQDGGQLKIYGEEVATIVKPIYNRAVLFKSDIVLHEVLRSEAERRSLTGWLLNSPANVGVLGI